MYLLQK